jgi:hypothetical protein
MKKFLYILACVIAVLAVAYFSYGFYLNMTLVESFEYPNKTFGIIIYKTDETYESGICNQVLTIYPWEDVSHRLVTPAEYGHIKVDCTIRQDSMPFEYVRAWKNKRDIGGIFSVSAHPFWIVKNMFFNKPMTICLEGIDTPFPLKESNYSPSWFSMRGLMYNITLNDDLKNKWKTNIDGFFKNNSFPKTANIIQGSSCQNYSDRDIIKKYPVTSRNGWR